MPQSKVGLVCPRTAGHENDGDIRWCKHICRFPNPGTFSPEYRTWRNAIKRWMEREGIQSFRQSSAAQWARLQAYALTMEPIASNGRAQYWEKDTPRGRRFTECLNYLLKDVVKKHSQTVKAMIQALPPATPVPAAGAAGNDRLAGPRSVRLWVDIPSVGRPGEPLAPGLDNVQWKTHGAVYWLELIEPTQEHLLGEIDRVIARGIGYRQLVGATRYGTLLLLDDPEEPLPISEMIVIRTDQHVRIWWSLSPANEPMDLLFRFHRDADDEDGTPPVAGQRYHSRNNRDDPEEPGAEEEAGEEEAEEEEEEEEAGEEEAEEEEEAEAEEEEEEEEED